MLTITVERDLLEVPGDWAKAYKPGPDATLTVKGPHEAIGKISHAVYEYAREHAEELGLGPELFAGEQP